MILHLCFTVLYQNSRFIMKGIIHLTVQYVFLLLFQSWPTQSGKKRPKRGLGEAVRVMERIGRYRREGTERSKPEHEGLKNAASENSSHICSSFNNDLFDSNRNSRGASPQVCPGVTASTAQTIQRH